MTLQRQYIAAVSVIWLLFTACTATRQPGDVTVTDLFAHPAWFDGKQVAVIGYYESGIEERSLFPGKNRTNVPLNKGFDRSIWVEGGSDRFSHRDVRVVGVFHYRPKFRRTIEKRDDGREFE